MTFIDNAGQLWHRFWSQRFAALAALLNAALIVATMALPEHTSLRIALVVGLLALSSSLAGMYARMVKQPALASVGECEADPVREAAIEDVRELMAAHGLTVDQVFGNTHVDH